MKDAREYLRIQRRMWIAIHDCMMKEGCLHKQLIQRVMYNADDHFWELEKQDYQQQLLWLNDTYDINGRYNNGWFTEKRKQVVKYNDLYNKSKLFKNSVIAKLRLNKNATQKEILEAIGKLKHKKRDIYIIKK